MELLRELGVRLRACRLQANRTAADVATRAGLNRNTVVNAERGANPRLLTVVRMLRVLGRLDALDAFLPPPAISPLQLVARAGKPRLRARTSRRA
jgi:transcriptional regulator with XRE-family HTH domain